MVSWARVTSVATAVRRWVVRAPGTHVYLLVLLVTTAPVRSLHPVLATALLREVSTNLTQMGRSAGRVLFLSAFLLDGGRWITQVVLFSLVYAPVERWAGSWRWLAVVVAGHVGATLVTTVGIWADVRSNRGAVQLADTIDVGVSYGFYAVAAFGTFGLGRRWMRIAARVALAGVLGRALVTRHTFTDMGHVAAMCIGGAMYIVLGPGLSRRPTLWSRSSSPRSAVGLPMASPVGTAPSP